VLNYEIKQVQEKAVIQHFYTGFYPEYVPGNQFLKYLKGCLSKGTAFLFFPGFTRAMRSQPFQGSRLTFQGSLLAFQGSLLALVGW
jgi:hypothetical protein